MKRCASSTKKRLDLLPACCLFQWKASKPEALAVANSTRLSGDLGISLFTSRPHSPEIQRMARELRHGIVTINTYPGVAFATSVPWGAGPARMSGNGWVHNYAFLPESEIEKVVLRRHSDERDLVPIRWEDPWLLNVSGENTVEFAKSLVQVTLAYFLKQPLKLAKAQLSLIRAIRRRESAARKTDQVEVRIEAHEKYVASSQSGCGATLHREVCQGGFGTDLPQAVAEARQPLCLLSPFYQ